MRVLELFQRLQTVESAVVVYEFCVVLSVAP
jgi:hypothetical protein